MKNKTLGNGLLASIGLGFFVGVFEPELSANAYSILLTLSGLGMMFFGIWGAIRLIKFKQIVAEQKQTNDIR